MKNHAGAIKFHTSSLSSIFLCIHRNVMLIVAYSFFGWLVETSFILALQREFVQRGMITHGLPLIPLYGFSGWIIVHLLLRLKKWPALVFAGAAFLTTLIELLTSLMNTYIFHMTTWDYSYMPFSFEGRIALPITLGWGVLSLLVVYWLDPVVKKMIAKIKPLLIAIASVGFLFYYIFCTLSDILKK